MATDEFASILEEVGRIFQIKLIPDDKDSCLLRFRERTSAQMQIDRRHDRFIIAFPLGEIPPGRFREDVFIESLKANGAPHPRPGTFAYSEANKNLFFFHTLPLNQLKGSDVADALEKMRPVAQEWKDSLEKGTIPQVNRTSLSKGRSGGLFGLRP